jgi:hypothetical protein
MGTAIPGQFETAAWWNAQVRDMGNFLTGVPVFLGYQTATQTVSDSIPANIAIDTELIDTDGGHSNTTNNYRYTATVPGTYLVLGCATFAGNTTGYRRAFIYKNGTATASSGSHAMQTQSVVAATQTSTVVTMNGTTDYVSVVAVHDAGVSLSTSSSGGIASSLAVVWLSA